MSGTMTMIRSYLSELEKYTNMPFKSPKVIYTTYNLVTKYYAIEASDLLSIIFNGHAKKTGELSIDTMRRLWEGRKDKDLGVVVYYVGRNAVNSYLLYFKAQKRQMDIVSLNAPIGGDTLEDMVAGNTSEENTNDYTDAFNYILNNLLLDEREKKIFIMKKEEKSLRDIGIALNASHECIRQIYDKIEHRLNLNRELLGV
jgi:hypothetical protein